MTQFEKAIRGLFLNRGWYRPASQPILREYGTWFWVEFTEVTR